MVLKEIGAVYVGSDGRFSVCLQRVMGSEVVALMLGFVTRLCTADGAVDMCLSLVW